MILPEKGGEGILIGVSHRPMTIIGDVYHVTPGPQICGSKCSNVIARRIAT